MDNFLHGVIEKFWVEALDCSWFLRPSLEIESILVVESRIWTGWYCDMRLNLSLLSCFFYFIQRKLTVCFCLFQKPPLAVMSLPHQAMLRIGVDRLLLRISFKSPVKRWNNCEGSWRSARPNVELAAKQEPLPIPPRGASSPLRPSLLQPLLT